eukprot:s1833_g8.t1
MDGGTEPSTHEKNPDFESVVLQTCKRGAISMQFDHFRGVKIEKTCKDDQTKRDYGKRHALEAQKLARVDMPVFTKCRLICQLPRCSLSRFGWLDLKKMRWT